ncbi:hypothetical protein [Polymorphospora rubra]|uniref:hypothetical protein n=1 Tax=Polymorphospora rubra TaxID=338584 RepID=UPI0033ECCC40
MTRQHRRRRLVATLLPLLLAGGLTAGCTGSDPAEDGDPMTIRLLVREFNLREIGVDCAGSGAYLFVHRTAPYRLVDGDGAELVSGELPTGTSVAAFEEDLEVPRVPTFCEFAVPVTVPKRDAYQIVIDDRPPIALTTDRENPEGGPSLVAVIP